MPSSFPQRYPKNFPLDKLQGRDILLDNYTKNKLYNKILYIKSLYNKNIYNKYYIKK